jgi:hypothetical protein
MADGSNQGIRCGVVSPAVLCRDLRKVTPYGSRIGKTNQLKTKSDNEPRNFGSKLENPKEGKTNFGILQSETCKRSPTAAGQLLCPDSYE